MELAKQLLPDKLMTNRYSKKYRIMSEQQIDELREKLNRGIALSRKRLIDETKRNGGSLVIARDGKIVVLSASEL